MYNLLKNQILAIVPFTEKEIDYIINFFEFRIFETKEYILDASNVANEIHFIVEGLVRVYYIKEGKKITTYLACDNSFITSFSSFLNQNESLEYIQCIEPTQTLCISHQNMQLLYKEIPAWEKVGRILAEHYFLCMADRVLKLHMIQAREKYLIFLKTSHPKIIQRTPLIYISSFLGITPESLSRIRQIAYNDLPIDN